VSAGSVFRFTWQWCYRRSVDDLGQDEHSVASDGFLIPPSERLRALRGFYKRTFDARMFLPSAAARGGLELLRRGGSLIVLPEFYGNVCGPIVGRSVSVAVGPVWLARHAPAPIVPFLLIPAGGASRYGVCGVASGSSRRTRPWSPRLTSTDTARATAARRR
jgi:hypothetical protein